MKTELPAVVRRDELPLVQAPKRAGALVVRWRGRIRFADALAQQETLVEKKWRDSNQADEFWLLEHDPVYTIGRTPDQSSLRGATHLPHPLFQINRGGQATYHGPGQLIGYLLLDLRRYGQDLHRYLRWIEALLIELLQAYEIPGRTREGSTGVWVGERKIASIGVGVRHWVTMHGFALNISGDLAPFEQITPCGINNVRMTSIQAEFGMAPSLAAVAELAADLAVVRLDDLSSDETAAGRRDGSVGPVQSLVRPAGRSSEK